MWPAEAVLNLPNKLDGRLSRPGSSDHGSITGECRPPGAAILGLTETPRCRPQTAVSSMAMQGPRLFESLKPRLTCMSGESRRYWLRSQHVVTSVFWTLSVYKRFGNERFTSFPFLRAAVSWPLQRHVGVFCCGFKILRRSLIFQHKMQYFFLYSMNNWCKYIFSFENCSENLILKHYSHNS